jgi:hypothetical protein
VLQLGQPQLSSLQQGALDEPHRCCSSVHSSALGMTSERTEGEREKRTSEANEAIDLVVAIAAETAEAHRDETTDETTTEAMVAVCSGRP